MHFKEETKNAFIDYPNDLVEVMELVKDLTIVTKVVKVLQLFSVVILIFKHYNLKVN